MADLIAFSGSNLIWVPPYTDFQRAHLLYWRVTGLQCCNRQLAARKWRRSCYGLHWSSNNVCNLHAYVELGDLNLGKVLRSRRPISLIRTGGLDFETVRCSAGTDDSCSNLLLIERQADTESTLSYGLHSTLSEGAAAPSNEDGNWDCGKFGDSAFDHGTEVTHKTNGKKRRALVVKSLLQGNDPIGLLQSYEEWSPPAFWGVVDFLKAHKRFSEALQVFEWWKTQPNYRARDQHYTVFIQMLGKAQRPDIAQFYFDEMKAVGILPSVATWSALLQGYAECGIFDKAEKILKHMVVIGTKPNTVTYSGLIHAYGKWGHYDDMARIFNNMKTVGCLPDIRTYSSLIQAYARGGLFRRMESSWREMLSRGWKPDSASINSIIQAYASSGTVREIQQSCTLLQNYRIFANKESIRAIAMAYIRHSKFYQLRQFVKDIGLNRKDVGNLLWNLLLLSYAANFQMRNLQREFQVMVDSGFYPDLTTFNIRAIGFSRLQMFWDLHITALHMRSSGIFPDLVTFGTVVDAYLSGRLQFRKLFQALDDLKMKELCPDVRTDPIVFEAFGRGDFQQSCEALVQSSKMYGTKWTYGKLTSAYLKRFSRRSVVPGN